MSDKKMPKKKFGFKRGEITQDLEMLHNEDILNLYSLFIIVNEKKMCE
jgi:hypothetical protein